MKKRISSSNGLVLFNNPEDLQEFILHMLKRIPFPGKGERMAELGAKSFEVLDLICEMMVPPKELSQETKRNAVNSFLDTKVNSKISKKTDDHFGQKIEDLSILLVSLENISENHNMILKGLSQITSNATKSSLRNEILSKAGVQISSFEKVLHLLIDQAANDQKNIQRIKDSIDEIIESRIVKEKSALKALGSISQGLMFSLKSFIKITSQSDDYKQVITEYCNLQKEYQSICMKSVA